MLEACETLRGQKAHTGVARHGAQQLVHPVVGLFLGIQDGIRSPDANLLVCKVVQRQEVSGKRQGAFIHTLTYPTRCQSGAVGVDMDAEDCLPLLLVIRIRVVLHPVGQDERHGSTEDESEQATRVGSRLNAPRVSSDQK